jgi:hypothetical protein
MDVYSEKLFAFVSKMPASNPKIQVFRHWKTHSALYYFLSVFSNFEVLLKEEAIKGESASPQGMNPKGEQG